MKPESKKQPVMGESHEQLREATLQEVQNLPDKLPARVWLACLIAGAERFSFYGVQAMIRQ